MRFNYKHEFYLAIIIAVICDVYLTPLVLYYEKNDTENRAFISALIEGILWLLAGFMLWDSVSTVKRLNSIPDS